ncbi:YrhK-like protein [Oryzisolibacter propanilivorax]|uniref:YrhK-like protein n=1 Tax=Oryzisolibacter propanilivorax TaxID=1527607 RepID=A0A1G9V6A8_9BURK|nr:YrhK family protein [Oryzisolibacter propanilivorax]SDM67694.1 YrhK-like protein [Oryzisolibacter propanilivorax]
MQLGDLFSPTNRSRTQAARERFARFELLRSAVQFLAALCFLAGSVIAVLRAPHDISSWLYISGSVLFCSVPAVRLWSEVALYRMGHTDTLAERGVELSPAELARRRERQRKRQADPPS